MTRTVEDEGSSLRTDNIEGDRIVPATDWVMWALAAAGLLFGRTGDAAGIAWYILGAFALMVATSLSFIFKKVQVLKNGRWETLKKLASPSQAAEIVGRLRLPINPKG